METNERILEFIDYKGISVNFFERSIGKSTNYVRNSKSFTSNVLATIMDVYPELNIEWLVTGKGNMLKSKEAIPTIKVNTVEDGIPYYADLPVSAGQLDTFIQDAAPTGWVKLPGVTSKALFPVIGCSMKPEINPGDVVGIIQIDSWEVVDPDKVYLIIMHDERMIKHLAIDEEDDSILWCISPNYPKFKINKEDIKFIYRISFCGKLM